MAVVIKKALHKVLKSEGFNCAWNEGKAAEQTVPHFHSHIVPRIVGDNGILNYEPRDFLYRPGSREESPERELYELAYVLKEAIQY